MCDGPFIPWAAGFGAAPVKAARVLGVMVGPVAGGATPTGPLVTMARNAAVLGEGGGKEVGPPASGVSPVRKLLRSGVNPVRKDCGSKPLLGLAAEERPTPWDEEPAPFPPWLDEFCGPASMAGLSGPARREPVRLVDQGKDGVAAESPEGEVMDATGGSTVLYSERAAEEESAAIPLDGVVAAGMTLLVVLLLELLRLRSEMRLPLVVGVPGSALEEEAAVAAAAAAAARVDLVVLDAPGAVLESVAAAAFSALPAAAASLSEKERSKGLTSEARRV